MSSQNLLDLRGNTITLDPRSKILTTFILVLGVAISIDRFQILLYSILLVPLLFLYRPKIIFLKRLILAFPFIIFISIAFYFGIADNTVRISLIGYTRDYNRDQFVGLIIFRYTISILFTYILIYSEYSYVDIIEAISSFKIARPFNSILLLINRLASRLLEDYDKMVMAAKTKGAFERKGPRELFIRIRILARILARTSDMSNTVSNTLIARGFTGRFSSTTRDWTSEGMSITLIAASLFVAITAIPWMRS